MEQSQEFTALQAATAAWVQEVAAHFAALEDILKDKFNISDSAMRDAIRKAKTSAPGNPAKNIPDLVRLLQKL